MTTLVLHGPGAENLLLHKKQADLELIAAVAIPSPLL